MWYSLLPASLSTIEHWAARVFLFLGLLTIGPWLALIVYDLLYYCYRSITYEVPVIGGRARGRQRPRAPSLTERPSGRPRSFGMGMPGRPGTPNGMEREDVSGQVGGEGTKRRSRFEGDDGGFGERKDD